MILLIKVKGAVQGVGYRPFIAKKATEYGLKGYVKNIGAAVEILAAGDEAKVKAFAYLLKTEYPAGAFILDVEISEKNEETVDLKDFSIVESSDINLSSELPVFPQGKRRSFGCEKLCSPVCQRGLHCIS